jgi:hypothetical protein
LGGDLSKLLIFLSLCLLASSYSYADDSNCPISRELAMSFKTEGPSNKLKQYWQTVFELNVDQRGGGLYGWPGPKTRIVLSYCRTKPKLFMYMIVSDGTGIEAHQFDYFSADPGKNIGMIVGYTQLYENLHVLNRFSILRGPKLTSFTQNFWDHREDISFPTPFKKIVFGIAFNQENAALVIRDEASDQLLNYLVFNHEHVIVR